MRKIAPNRLFSYFYPLLNLSENWSLLTLLTNLEAIHETLFKLSRPQVNVTADANANAEADEAELQMQ